MSLLQHELHWNTTLPPVDVDVLIAMKDGTVWKVHRTSWLLSSKDDPRYTCSLTGHKLDVADVIGWRYI